MILKDDLIGIQTPILKKIAKEISKYDYKGYIKLNSNKTYEEKTIQALIIGYLKDFDETIYYLENFIHHIDNWATCDLICSNLKVFKYNKEKGYKFIKKIIGSNNEWKIRIGLVLLLNYYIEEEYIDKIAFTAYDSVKWKLRGKKFVIVWNF